MNNNVIENIKHQTPESKQIGRNLKVDHDTYRLCEDIEFLAIQFNSENPDRIIELFDKIITVKKSLPKKITYEEVLDIFNAISNKPKCDIDKKEEKILSFIKIFKPLM